MKRKSFTAIETLLTIGVIAVTTGVSIPMYRNFQIRTDLDLATEQTIQALRSAQVRSQAGEEDAQWGVWTSDGILFQGETYSLRNPDADEEYPIPSTISVSGLSQVTFSRVDGVPQYVGDIILEAINGDQRTITVSADGVLSSTGIESPVFSDDDDDDDSGADDDDDDDDSGSDDDDDSGSDDDDSGSDDDDTVADDDSGDDDTVADDDDDSGSGDDDDDDDSEPTEPCEDRFNVSSNGTIETTGTVDATFKALGSEITYGAGGPEIQVTVEASTDGGSTWIPLFGGVDIDGGEEQVIENLPSGSHIVLRFKGRHRWFWQKTYKSNDQTGHVEVLRDGNSPPDYQPYANQASLESFLQEVIDDNGKIDIGEYDVVLLGELGTLRTASSDFQDAVVLIEFRQKAGSCAGTDDPRFKIDFERLENFGTGNVSRSVYVGPQQIRYTEGQWIPLKVNGVTIVDGGLVETVPGLAVERRNGAVRILLHGSHPSGGSKEIVDARITFDGALVQGADNDVGNNKSESPFNGIINDGPGGDEVTLGTVDALYQAKVTILDDAIFINWLEGSSDSG
ncbi:MAG: hypothetical protein QF741_04060, partial [Candidatus Peribacteraceae bacterium]|nr:hypothetical protein [Candidatus Peribacteraceae bacterium]